MYFVLFHRLWICDCFSFQANRSEGPERFEAAFAFITELSPWIFFWLYQLTTSGPYQQFRLRCWIGLGLHLGFQMDSPGLAIIHVDCLDGDRFGICLVFLGRFNKWITRL